MQVIFCSLLVTVLLENEAVYTATEVTCGWAGAVMKKAYPSILAGAVTQKLPVTPKKLCCVTISLNLND